MKRKTLIAILLTLWAGAAFAQQPHPAPHPENFAEGKAHLVEQLKIRSQVLQELTSCVQGAATPEALAVCRQKNFERNKARLEKLRGEQGPLGR